MARGAAGRPGWLEAMGVVALLLPAGAVWGAELPTCVGATVATLPVIALGVGIPDHARAGAPAPGAAGGAAT